MPGKVPEGMHTVTPSLVIKGAAEAIEFYTRAFNAVETFRMPGPDPGTLVHAEIKIGDSTMFLCDEWPEMGSRGPLSLGGSPVVIHLYVEDADALFNQAVAAGATPLMPPADMFWGDRFSRVADPFGHQWAISSQIETVDFETMQERAVAFFAESSKQA